MRIRKLSVFFTIGLLWFFVLGCTDVKPEIVDLGSQKAVQVPAPTFSGSHSLSLKIETPKETVKISGEIDSLVRDVKVQFEGNSEWKSIKELKNSKANIDSTGGQFSFEVENIETHLDLSGTGQIEKKILLFGEGIFGQTGSSTITITYDAPISTTTSGGGGENNPNFPEFDPLLASCPTVDEDQSYICSLSATDADGDQIAYSLSTEHTCSSWLTLDTATGALSGVPLDADVGTCVIAVRAEDNGDPVAWKEQKFDLVINNVNDTPTIAQNVTCPTTLTEDTSHNCSFTLQDDDIDSGDTLTLSVDATSTCSWATSKTTINSSTNELTITPDNNDVSASPCDLIVKVEDSAGASATETITITAVSNVAPGLTVSGSLSALSEDDPLTTLLTDAEVSSGDEGVGLAYSLIAGSVNDCIAANLGAFSIDANTGQIDFTPGADKSGNCNFKIQADDSHGGIDVSGDILLTINSVNDAPVINAASCLATIDQNGSYSCTVTATDIEGNTPITFGPGPGHTCSWASIAANGAVTSTLNDDQVGLCDIVIEATDSLSAKSIHTVAVDVTNIAPTLSIGNPPAIAEDSGLNNIQSDANVSASEEGFGDYQIVASVTSPDCQSHGTVTINTSTGAIDFTPAAQYSGNCHINVEFDDKNTVSGNNKVTDEFQVTVTPTNDPPTLTTNTPDCLPGGATEDVLFTCDIDGADSDPGDTLTYSITSSGCSWINASHINSATGVISVTPDNTHSGHAACDVNVKVEDPSMASDTKNFNMPALANVAPTLTISDVTHPEDIPSTVIVNAAASDEGQGATVYSLLAPTNSPACSAHQQGGTPSINSSTGEITYHPEANWNGDCYIKTSFNDGHGATVNVEFKVTLTPVNDPPVISSGPGCSNPATRYQPYFCPTGFTVNDADGDPYTFKMAPTNTCKWAGVTPSGDIFGLPRMENTPCDLIVVATDGVANSTPFQVVGSLAMTVALGQTTISAGADHTCARESGKAKCWGSNAAGQLGTGAQGGVSISTVEVGFGNSTSEMTAGKEHSCGIFPSPSPGTVKCWGKNDKGQLGNNSLVDSPSPVVVVDSTLTALSNVKAISAGDYHTCALMSDGKVKCWGDGSAGRVGDGNTSTHNVITAMKVQNANGSDLDDAIQVSAGGLHTCALLNSSQIKCWGNSGKGQLGTAEIHSGVGKAEFVNNKISGIGTITIAPGTTAVVGAGTSFSTDFFPGMLIHIQGVNYVISSVTDNLNMTLMGNHGSGVAGSIYERLFPVINAKTVSAGFQHTCLGLINGSVQCWGDNAKGQLGIGNTVDHSVPSGVLPGISGVKLLAAGLQHTCAWNQSGSNEVKCWGENNLGQLGDGTTSPSHIPITTMTMGSGVEWVTAGYFHTCALQSGSFKCWGRHSQGQLGHNAPTTPIVTNPVNVHFNPAPTCPSGTSPHESHMSGMIMCRHNGVGAVQAYGSWCDAGYHMCKIDEYRDFRSGATTEEAWLSFIDMGGDFHSSTDGTTWVQRFTATYAPITKSASNLLCNYTGVLNGQEANHCGFHQTSLQRQASMCCPD